MPAPAFDPYAYAASQDASPAPASASAAAASGATSAAPFDPYAYAASLDETQSRPTQAAPVQASGQPQLPNSIFTPAQDWLTGFGGTVASGIGGSVAGGLRGLWDIATGKGLSTAVSDIHSTENDVSNGLGMNAPLSKAEQSGISTAESDWNPLNWPGIVASKVGGFAGNTAANLGAPPIVSTALNVAPAAALSIFPLTKGGFRAGAGIEGEEAADTASEFPADSGAAAQPKEKPDAPTGEKSKKSSGAQVHATPDSSPQPSATAQAATPDERQSILQNVGLQNIRKSAITGNMQDAATDYQMSRYDQPAGRAAAAQFEHELNTMANYASGIVEGTGGTLGMDEAAMANKGEVIDRPWALVRKYFDGETQAQYAEADARAQGVPVVLQNFARTLNDDSLMTNQDRMALRNGLKSYINQLNMVGNSPEGPVIRGTALNAETIRKYLNSEWSPQNSRYTTQLKNALDEDVTRAAGTDVYQKARAVRALKGRILEDPNGVSQLFETDPNTPINRTTPLEKIPSRLLNLPVDQFANILSILKQMPEQIQPAAQAALGEIKGYMAEKLLRAGTETARGGSRAVWNGDAVSNVLKSSAAKYNLAFADDPEALTKITNLNKAGQILKTPTSYPGADAQAANSMKRGLFSRVTPSVTRMGGATLGGFFGPVGAAVGEGAGSAAGNALGMKAAEQAALKLWNKRVVTAGSD